MQIAYLGPKGSFSYSAAVSCYPEADFVPFATIDAVILAYESGEVEAAIFPIENSIEGSVNLAVDTLYHKSSAQVKAELVLPISQNLLLSKVNKNIEKIYSHPQALAQTREYLTERYPTADLVAVDSTAQAAELLSENPSEPWAAVATVEAAELYDLELVAKNIQDVKANNTRFWLLSKNDEAISLQSEESKVSLAIILPKNLPGALHKAISVFAWRGIDMTKIQSRPLKTELGQYFFLIDLATSPLMKYALEELESLGIKVRKLGEYRVYEVK